MGKARSDKKEKRRTQRGLCKLWL